MQNEKTVQGLIDSTLSGLRSIGDVGNIVGETIQMPDGSVIIPISKVSVGFAVGGSDFSTKKDSGDSNFAGGGGGGVTINPVAFLVVSGDTIKMMKIDSGASIDLTEIIPAVIDMTSNLFSKKSNEKNK